MKRISFVLCICILSILAGCTRTAATMADAAGEKRQTIRLGTPDGNGRLYGVEGIAYQKGFLAEELSKAGYDFEVVGFAGAGPGVNEALASGAIDFASYAEVPGLIIGSKMEEHRLMAVTNGELHCAILTKKSSNIQSIQELKGKKVGFIKGTYLQRYLMERLKEEGIAAEEVDLIQMSNDSEAALLGGTVDAICTTEIGALRILEKSQEVEMIDTSKEHQMLSGMNILTTTNKVLLEKEGAWEAILRGLYRAVDYVSAHEEECYEILAESTVTTVEMQKILNSFKGDNKERYSIAINRDDIEKLNATKLFLLENELLDKDFSIEEWMLKSLK
jgi:sulfonate transport system substrate-binding protein